MIDKAAIERFDRVVRVGLENSCYEYINHSVDEEGYRATAKANGVPFHVVASVREIVNNPGKEATVALCKRCIHNGYMTAQVGQA